MKLDFKIWPKQLNPKTANPTIYVCVIFMCCVLVKQLIAMWMFEWSELTNVSKISKNYKIILNILVKLWLTHAYHVIVNIMSIDDLYCVVFIILYHSYEYMIKIE